MRVACVDFAHMVAKLGDTARAYLALLMRNGVSDDASAIASLALAPDAFHAAVDELETALRAI